MRRTVLLMLFVLLSCHATRAQSMNDQLTTAKRGDNSDWWSITRDPNGPNIKPRKRVPSVSNFSILGIRLGGDDESAQIVAKLGKVEFVFRGDAASGRIQACYVSAGSSPAVHLIFEQGEVDDAFYLFSGGPNWQRSDLCTKSELVSSRLKTGSGLALGETRSQVEAILGKPTAIRANRLMYAGEVLVKPLGHSDSYRLYTYIEARFTNARLTYLGVMKSQTE